MEFFMPMVPPTATAQERKVVVKDDKVQFYDPANVRRARKLLMGHLGQHKPEQPITAACELIVKWCFPRKSHPDGSYRTSRPDTDNLQKLLKDCMTKMGFWKDDALVCREIVEKFWAEVPGIYIRISEL